MFIVSVLRTSNGSKLQSEEHDGKWKPMQARTMKQPDWQATCIVYCTLYLYTAHAIMISSMCFYSSV